MLISNYDSYLTSLKLKVHQLQDELLFCNKNETKN